MFVDFGRGVEGEGHTIPPQSSKNISEEVKFKEIVEEDGNED